MEDASSEYIGYRLKIFICIFIPLQIVAVALRFYARSLTVTPYGLDDGLCVLSLFAQVVQAAMHIGSIIWAGVGYHVAYLEKTSPETVNISNKYTVASSAWYCLTANIGKLAICVMYRRLFPSPYRTVHIALWLTVSITISGAIATCIASLAACRPFWTNWGTPAQQKEHCIDRTALYVWGSFPNILTDVILLAIPMPIFWNLHTTFKIKVALTITFLFGSIGLITSILRFVAFYNDSSFTDAAHTTNGFSDLTYTSATVLGLWTIAEPGMYLISACLLTYRPLLDKWKIIPLERENSHGARSKRGLSHDASDQIALRDLEASDGNELNASNRIESRADGGKRCLNTIKARPRLSISSDVDKAERGGDHHVGVGCVDQPGTEES